MWHVSSRSGEASHELLYSVYFTLLYISVVIIIIIIINSSSVTTQYIHCESKTIGQEPDYLTIYYKIMLVWIVRSTYDSDQPSRQYSFLCMLLLATVAICHTYVLPVLWAASCLHHRHGIDKYLDTLLANQTTRKASPPIIPKVAVARWRTARVIFSLILPDQSQRSRSSTIANGVSSAVRRIAKCGMQNTQPS